MEDLLGLLFVTFGLAFFLILLLIVPILYLALAFGLYRMAVNQGIDIAWLAFIPFVQFYLLGVLVQDRLQGTFRDLLPVLLIGLPVADFILSLILGLIPFAIILTLPITLASIGVYIFAFYLLFKKYSSNFAHLFYPHLWYTLINLYVLHSR